MEGLGAIPWTWVVAAGTLVLGAAIVVGMILSGRVTPRERQEAERGARRIYKQGENPEHRRVDWHESLQNGPVLVVIAITLAIAAFFLVSAIWWTGPDPGDEPAPIDTTQQALPPTQPSDGE